MFFFLFLLACGLGACLRFLMSYQNKPQKLPYGTLWVNLLGAFLIGLCYRHFANSSIYLIVATGFCGGLTTYSTLQLELLHQKQQKEILRFGVYLALTYGLGVLAVYLGYLL